MAQHILVKPQKLVETAVGLLEHQLILPKLFRRESLDQFKGVQNDTITYRVPGVLPGRDYAFRNDRSAPIVFDEYAETTVNVTLGGNAYSAVMLTDEQYDFDLNGWGKLLDAQVRGVGTKLQHGAQDALEGATYSVVVGGVEANLRAGIIEARRVLNGFGVTSGNRILVVGTDFESAMLLDEKLNLASGVPSAAEDALRNATIGRTYGFTVVVDQTIAPDTAYAFGDDAFIFATATPAIPQSVPFGASTSFEGIALRWVRDYDPTYLRDRSVVNTYYGYRPIVDTIRYWNKAATPDQEAVSAGQHFVRGIKLTMGGTSTYPATGSPLAIATGVVAPA